MKHDVVIVGAGIPGLALGLALAQAGRRVQLIDARAPAAPSSVPGQFDQRIYALSPANVAWLAALKVWAAVDAARVAPVYDMRVYGDAPSAALLPGWPAPGAAQASSGLHLSAYRSGVAELCWIVEEGELLRALESAAGFAANLQILRPAVPESLRQSQNGIELHMADGQAAQADLLVACDGARSWVREAAGIAAKTIEYGQTAVVANFHAERPHRNCAYQWFLSQADGGGVLAWLPLPQGQVSMVWSAGDARAEELQSLDDASLASRAAAAGAHTLGAFTPAGPAAGFPLRNLKAQRLIGPRLALAGDAAHVVHPLAGQGLNLGLADVRALAQALEGQRDCGAWLALRAYERGRKAAILEMHLLTHGLQRLFAATHPAVRAARNIGLNLTGRLPVLTGMIARHATR
jgi:ubiquinone biosynthesis UbiH/UbiF/VisC/COQ6 family hydroxylase